MLVEVVGHPLLQPVMDPLHINLPIKVCLPCVDEFTIGFVLQYFNVSLTALYIYLDCPLVISIITIVSLLIILLAGDVETNPGPVPTGLLNGRVSKYV